MDKDGKMQRDADGKIVMSGPLPITFIQGMGRTIPGFDQGFDGMKIGGKRRIFIPWQLAYGAVGRPGPDAAHPGIPAKANLIFDVELIDQRRWRCRRIIPPMGATICRQMAERIRKRRHNQRHRHSRRRKNILRAAAPAETQPKPETPAQPK